MASLGCCRRSPYVGVAPQAVVVSRHRPWEATLLHHRGAAPEDGQGCLHPLARPGHLLHWVPPVVAHNPCDILVCRPPLVSQGASRGVSVDASRLGSEDLSSGVLVVWMLPEYRAMVTPPQAPGLGTPPPGKFRFQDTEPPRGRIAAARLVPPTECNMAAPRPPCNNMHTATMSAHGAQQAPTHVLAHLPQHNLVARGFGFGQPGTGMGCPP